MNEKTVSYLIKQMENDERKILDKLGSFYSTSSQWNYYHGQLVYIRLLRDKLQTWEKPED